MAATLVAVPMIAAAAEPPESAAIRAVEAAKSSPVKLRALLRKMPKGGDLHNHLAGTPYAEDYLAWAGDHDLCINTAALAIAPGPCASDTMVPAKGLAIAKPRLYAAMVDSLSVRGVLAGTETERSGHDQFFGTFSRFTQVFGRETGRSLASARTLAALDHVSYLELSFNPPSIDRYVLSSTDPSFDPDDLRAAYKRFAPEIPGLVAKGMQDIDATVVDAEKALECKGKSPADGCDVNVLFSCYGLRVLPAAQVFRHIVLCFAMAQADPRFVGMSLVAPEDDPVALADYTLHMKMVAFAASKYPAAKIALHAGELHLGLVPPPALSNHIAEAIGIAGSQRIGHGIDIAFEADSAATLAVMARRRIAVEINLTSNDVILGVKGGDHPVNLYRAAGVPIVLSTDDQGVLRTDMTEQYVRAVLEHGFDYLDLKTAARNAIEYSFVPGASLWAEGRVGEPVAACSRWSSADCAKLLKSSRKARLSLQLEQDFAKFEAAIAARSVP